MVVAKAICFRKHNNIEQMMVDCLAIPFRAAEQYRHRAVRFVYEDDPLDGRRHNNRGYTGVAYYTEDYTEAIQRTIQGSRKI